MFKKMVKYSLAAIFITTAAITNIATAQIPTYQVLERESSSRAAGMAGAFSAVKGDVHSIFYNPAGLTNSGGKVFAVTYNREFLDIYSGQLAYSMPYKNKALGFGVSFVNYGEFDGMDKLGNPAPDFGANDALLVAGFSYNVNEKLSAGVTGKYLISKLEEYSSSAVMADLGMVYSMPSQKMNVGFVLSNIGTVLNDYYKEEASLPALAKLSVTKKLEHAPLMLSVEYRKYFEADYVIVGGTEIYFNKTFTARLGYNSLGEDQVVGDERGVFPGASFGFGLNMQNYNLDYAFTSMGAMGNQNRLTIVWSY